MLADRTASRFSICRCSHKLQCCSVEPLLLGYDLAGISLSFGAGIPFLWKHVFPSWLIPLAIVQTGSLAVGQQGLPAEEWVEQL